MNYYYAVAGHQNGPITEEQLDQMVAQGTLSPTTLVWREGMATWQAYSTIKPGAIHSALPTSPDAPGAVTCTVCRQSYPPEQVVRYGATPVCRNCQPGFIQSLPAGTPIMGLRYAGFWKRFLAKFVDGFLVMLVLGPVELAGMYDDNPIWTILYAVLWPLCAFGYPIFCLGKWGQTVGKMALKIKVVSPEGSPISYGTATLRVFAEILSSCFFIGYIMAAFDDEKRALHDRLASTRVIEID